VQTPRLAILTALVLAGAIALPAAAGQKPVASAAPWTGDFDAMLERRVIRVLVPPSRTLYFPDKGSEKGLTAELVRDFEHYLNRKYKSRLQRRPVTVVLIPTTRDRLLPDLVAGLGDIAAGNLTVTGERLEMVDFYTPADLRSISEVVLTGPRSAPVATVGDLSGRTVHARPSSSYHESLVALNARFLLEGRAPVKIVAVPDALEDEDMMEMLNAGLLDLIVVDDWKAKMWAKVLPAVKVHADVVVRSGGHAGWAMRKDSPQLRAAFESFYVEYAKKQGVIEYRLAMYNKKVKQLQDPTGREDWKRFQETVALFERYGEQYGFDPLLLVAQGYQESQLDQGARGPTGAVGIMQVMPATGAELKVGDISVTENNIHAGVKYMDTLHAKYFPEPELSDLNRTLMCFAAYNAGPARIASLRKTATERGLDPNQWFNHVEIVVAEKIGRETTTYVRNIYKYYVSYTLVAQAEAERQRARETVAPGDMKQE
jgi:membrane-bound lytic murein transglycosylase MltF